LNTECPNVEFIQPSLTAPAGVRWNPAQVRLGYNMSTFLADGTAPVPLTTFPLRDFSPKCQFP
jgi:hypothetical protein